MTGIRQIYWVYWVEFLLCKLLTTTVMQKCTVLSTLEKKISVVKPHLVMIQREV